MPFSCPQCHSSLDTIIPEPPGPPIPQVLASLNQPLSSTDGIALREAVRKAVSQREALDAQVAELETLLAKCKTARREHNSFLTRHRPILSSPRILPREVLIECFRYAWEDIPTEKIVLLSSTSAPMSISQVSQDWRQLALQTPDLWSHIDIRVCQSLPLSKLHLVNLALVRAKTVPLDITFMLEASYDSMSSGVRERVDTLLRMLISRAHFWKSADLSLAPELFDDSSFFPITDCLNLETLCLSTFESVDHQDWDSLRPVFIPDAPKLHKLYATDFSTPLESFRTMVPWTSLTLVWLSGYEVHFTTDHIVHVLRSSPNLTTLAIIGDFSDPGETLEHGCLQTLHLECPGSDILPRLDLPSLRCLSLCCLSQIGTKTADVASFLGRCPSLKELTFEDCEEIRLPDLFPAKLGITTLDIIISNLDESNLVARDLGSIANLTLPNLGQLTITLQPLREGFAVPVVNAVQMLASSLESRKTVALTFVTHCELGQMCTLSAEAILALKEISGESWTVEESETRKEVLNNYL
ncbi:hypothetical protein DL96DRAFT_1121162 [Flagelloscypha sp. PMI_526]|nr:hypothetical protein DL96DRAFT_1121162 [Flagelloscypha sp. PMI_526]